MNTTLENPDHIEDLEDNQDMESIRTTGNRVSTPTSGWHVASARVGRITLRRVIGSEWIKLRTLRSTWVMVAAIGTVMVGFGALAASVAAGSVTTPDGDGGPFGSADPLGTVLTGATFGVLLLGVMGSLAGAREYGSRMITATVAAAPRRWQVIVGKAAALTAVVLPASLVAVLAAFGVGMSILDANGEATVSLTDADVLGSVIGMAGYMSAIALLGLGLGVTFRSIAGSIAAIVAGVMIIPGLAGALLPDSWDPILKYLPEQAASSFTAVGQAGDPSLGAAAGIAVLTGWVAAALAGAVVTITRRDV